MERNEQPQRQWWALAGHLVAPSDTSTARTLGVRSHRRSGYRRAAVIVSIDQLRCVLQAFFAVKTLASSMLCHRSARSVAFPPSHHRGAQRRQRRCPVRRGAGLPTTGWRHRRRTGPGIRALQRPPVPALPVPASWASHMTLRPMASACALQSQTGRRRILAEFSPRMAFFSACERTGNDTTSSAVCLGSYHG